MQTQKGPLTSGSHAIFIQPTKQSSPCYAWPGGMRFHENHHSSPKGDHPRKKAALTMLFLIIILRRKTMKNRKLAIVAFILISSLIVGFGYAALTDTLTINGDLEFSAEAVNEAFNQDVYFSDVSITSTDADGATDINPNDVQKLSASINSNDPDKITFNAKSMWQHVGQTVTIVATITNTGEHAQKTAKLAVSVNTATGNDYFETVSKTFSASSGTSKNVETDGLPIGETCTLTIVFRCKALPSDTAAASIIYDLVATAVE